MKKKPKKKEKLPWDKIWKEFNRLTTSPLPEWNDQQTIIIRLVEKERNNVTK